MPVLICSYCGKSYKVDNNRYERAISGKTKNPTCSKSCKNAISALVPKGRSGSNIKAKKLF